VRDEAGRDVLDRVEGRILGDALAYGPAVPGLFAGVVLVDESVLDRETTSARRLWLAILVGAACAVVAASLLAVRAVLREVRLARMKSDFVSNLSHELRTPLTSLRMFVEMLREGRVRDEAEAKECLDVVAQETERLQSLVERVLQFASFTRGRAPIELKSADAGEVARRAVALFRKRAESAQASLELVVESPLPESILDRNAVLQVLLNLLDNAVKYGGENGAKIRVGVRPEGPVGTAGGVVIEVEDSGPGVPERERELVFEEFYRGDDTLSRRVEGTGIGLAVARRIALAHGGRIEVSRSERLGGARFTVTLPDAETGRRLALAASRETES
jgi:signal transduction histidine kinase